MMASAALPQAADQLVSGPLPGDCGPAPEPLGQWAEWCRRNHGSSAGGGAADTDCAEIFHQDDEALRRVAGRCLRQDMGEGFYRRFWCYPETERMAVRMMCREPICADNQVRDHGTRTCVHLDGYRYADPQDFMLNPYTIKVWSSVLLFFVLVMAVPTIRADARLNEEALSRIRAEVEEKVALEYARLAGR